MNKNAIIALWLLCAQPICAQEGPSAEAQANNPLAQFKTFNLHNQYTGALTGTDADATAVMTYDFETDNYNIPIGFGAGRVIKSGNATVNYFVEPQISVASRGNGQSEWGIFAGVNFQFPK